MLNWTTLLSFAIHEQKDRLLCFLLCQARQDLRSGLSLSAALKRHQAFPLILGKMIEVAESSGRLAEVLGMLLEFYQFQEIIIQEQIVHCERCGMQPALYNQLTKILLG